MVLNCKVEYSISAHGQGLLPVLLTMNEWGTEHIRHLSGLSGGEQN